MQQNANVTQHEDIVWVRRQWNDYRDASYLLCNVWDFHWSSTSGGVYARAPRLFVHAYVRCDQMISGTLAHSCEHGPGPHEIKVCVTKSMNKSIWPTIEKLVGPIKSHAI